jgi:multicomponent K+:H+ antiporter subunit A
MNLILVPLIPLLGALLPPLVARSGRDTAMAVTLAVTLTSLALLLVDAPAVYRGETVLAGTAWVPEIGLSFRFYADGLGLFFATMILAIGALIIVYARYYLSRQDSIGRFYAYLLLFQGAMVGIVLSDNILLMLIFWELTSLSSFLLIGFWSHAAAGRQGARMALVVTGGGGLLLTAGMLVLGHVGGSYELSVLLTRGEAIKASPLYPLILALVLAGAFTKSAQFPFHFWLPHAMAAPTPVSAYLHSATMVKAGVFLLARLWPVLAGTELWVAVVAPVGLITMLVGAWIALFKDDLKAILAYSTVSHLGLMVMLLGFGTPYAAVACVFHILNHATFKAALFMTAGIIDHEAGTRDIRRLGGLARLMPVTALLGGIAAASMAGLPPLNGFLSKEMMLEAAASGPLGGLGWLVPVGATLAALVSVAYSVRLAVGSFAGPVQNDYPHHPHDPGPGMWLPVALLVGLVVAIGLLPALIAGPIVARTAQAVIGGAPLPYYSLSLWHGLTPALFMSVAAVVGGLVAFRGHALLARWRAPWPRPEAKALFDRAVAAVVFAARWFTRRANVESLPRTIAIIAVSVLVVALWAFARGEHGAGVRAMLPVHLVALVAWAALVAASAVVVLKHGNRLLTLILTSVVGLVVSLAFIQFSAPDLALTQISVEVVSTILLLLALNLLPKLTPPETDRRRKLRDGAIAVAAGAGVAALAFGILTRDFTTISDYHIAQAKPGGGGTNVVNVILVDFRGFDTFGEIIVLGIAALAIFALLDTALRGPAARRLAAMRQGLESAEAHPLILVVATRAMLPLAFTVGAFIFLRGHNQPGGGFIAGLVIAIAYIMQYMASGYAWSHRRARFDAHTLVGAGVVIAGLTGLGSLLFGRPFLTSSFGYFHIPLIGEVELATAMAFDTGVFLAVVGTVLLALAQISRIEARAERSPVPEGPVDIRLAGAARSATAGARGEG